MPVRDLRAKYGREKGKTGEALRRAVRAECPGGNELLDALTIASAVQKKSEECRKIYQLLLRGRESMIAEIARRYEFKSHLEQPKETAGNVETVN